MVKQKLRKNEPDSKHSGSDSALKTIKKLPNKSISLLDQRVIQPTRRSSRNLRAAGNEILNCVVGRKTATNDKNSQNSKIDNTNSDELPRRNLRTRALNLNAYTKEKINTKTSILSKTVGQIIEAKHNENQNVEKQVGEILLQQVNGWKWPKRKCVVKLRRLSLKTIDNHRREKHKSRQTENAKKQSNTVTSNNKNCLLEKESQNQNSILEIEITNTDRSNFKKLSISKQSEPTFPIDQNEFAPKNNKNEEKIPKSKKLKQTEIVNVLNTEQQYVVPFKSKAINDVNYVDICSDDEWCTKDFEQINNNNETTSLKHRGKFFHKANIPNEFKDCNEGVVVINQEKSKNNSKNNVYEFLSLTQSSESDSDPAAEVINKLITEGKVQLANKRKNKKVIKRIKTTKVGEKKRKAPSKKKVKFANKVKAPNLEIVAPVDSCPPPIEILPQEIDDFNNDVHSDIDVQSHIEDKKSSHDNPGTFSSLARRVIMQQADKNRQNKQMLLDMAKKFVSTPINKQTVPNRESHLSPIFKPPTPMHSPKPWRVIDPKLPSLLDFNRSSGNLPSFSSFHIPKSPKKNMERTKQQHLNLEIDSLGETMKNNKNATHLETPNSANKSQNCISIPQTIVINASNSLSSFSSNDSNGENKPPPQKKNNNKIIDENCDIFNLRHIPNPRKTLSHRSPLKTINILEVVVLPPYKPQNCNTATIEEHVNSETKTNDCSEKSNENLFGFENDITYQPQNCNTATIEEHVNSETKTSDCSERNHEDLFGFENDITCEEIHNSICHNNLNNANKSLSEKLQNLKKWRPINNDEPHPQSQPIKEVFDDYLDRPKQRCIKQMLCSTFIDSPKCLQKKSPKDGKIVKQSVKNSEKTKSQAEESNLFKDFEPECTFNQEDSHRTYIRPLRQKRKICKNFLRYLDSDESGEDENNTSQHDDINTKKKQKRKDNPENPELKSFIKSFNEMCEEVENYNINIENIS
ncbi:protein dalmatian [Teleopsis dalmanni]|uniref:protein dalmatian n=1 Tax=Teleopsis dalmanni TaxID=139649 RepID=UPI0018CD6C2A|nr:protein dalmatian [Teleopsis dalmanni]